MLFEEYQLKKVELANRYVRSATADGMADYNGMVTDHQIEFFKKLSEGSIGLIVTGHMYVRSDGIGPAMNAVDKDECIHDLRKIADVVHSVGLSKVAVQINHAGRKATKCWGKDEIVAPSPIPVDDEAPTPRALRGEEMEHLATCYADAAVRVKEAGFDGVQIHGCHSWLISQFLSPLTNQRTDDFGGPLENRARFLELVVKSIRRAVGPEYLVFIKIASYENHDGGLRLEEGVQVGKWLEEWGIDAIEISGGVHSNSVLKNIKPGKNEGFHLEQTKAFKKALTVPIISVGGYRSLPFMEKVINEGDADLISLCRPFVREPNLVNDFKSGNKSVSKCESCNGCFKMMDEGHLECLVDYQRLKTC